MNRANSSREQQTLKIQQSLDLAIRHHTAGGLSQAEHIYQQILQTDPNQPVALHFLGVIAHQLSKNDVAEVFITKALAIKPDYAEAYNNLGLVFRDQGKLDGAMASYHKALSIKPDYAEAHNNLGISLQKLGKLDEAVVHYCKALGIKPNYVEAFYNRGNVLLDLEKPDEAVRSYHKALSIKPDYAEAHNNLGLAFQELGKLEEAVANHQKVIDIKPDYAEAHNNLGSALQKLGKLDEAMASYHKAISIKPNFADAHYNLGASLTEMGRVAEAKAAIDQGFHIHHGGSWWNAATFTDDDSPGTTPMPRGKFTSTFKLRDTIDQLEYLITKGQIDPSFQRLANRYRTVLAEMSVREEPEVVAELTSSQLERLGSSYNRVINYGEAPRIDTGAVNGSVEFKQIEDSYLSSQVSVTTLDDFLMPEALHKLRDFCLGSTIFFGHSGNHFVSSRLRIGFSCNLLYQVAEELRERFPRVLGDRHLANMWVYRYNNQSEGVAPHTDEGAVTFNFWITPNDANLVPDRGGLIVYTKEQPYDWDWRYYNRNKYTPAVNREITDFLTDADTVTIPYRENRAVLFHSNLFHKSDRIHFRDGFENRRMNITLLFGKREC